MKVRAEYKGPWSVAADFVRGAGDAFDLQAGSTKVQMVSLKTTLIH